MNVTTIHPTVHVKNSGIIFNSSLRLGSHIHSSNEVLLILPHTDLPTTSLSVHLLHLSSGRYHPWSLAWTTAASPPGLSRSILTFLQSVLHTEVRTIILENTHIMFLHPPLPQTKQNNSFLSIALRIKSETPNLLYKAPLSRLILYPLPLSLCTPATLAFLQMLCFFLLTLGNSSFWTSPKPPSFPVLSLSLLLSYSSFRSQLKHLLPEKSLSSSHWSHYTLHEGLLPNTSQFPFYIYVIILLLPISTISRNWVFFTHIHFQYPI